MRGRARIGLGGWGRWAVGFHALLASVLVAQPPGVALHVPTDTLEVGEAVNVRLIFTNTGPPGLPTLQAPDGLALRLLSQVPSVSRQLYSRPGGMTNTTTYTYALELVGVKEGRYTLGPFLVEADGKAYKTTPYIVTVRRTPDSASNKGDKFIFVDVEVDRRSVYVTETVTATLRIGIREVILGGRRINLNLFTAVLDQSASNFSVFRGGRGSRSRLSLTDSQGNRNQYEILEVVQIIRVEEVGPLAIGPIFVKANYPTQVRRGWFGEYEVAQVRKETDRADAIFVEVKAPPSQGRPAEYNGAIGQYAMTVSGKPTEVELGQPVTLTIEFQGNPLEGVAAPDLSRNAELASRFDFTLDDPIGDLDRGRKIFRLAIFPRQMGRQTIPPIRWAYFDPRKERYVALQSEPIPIEVAAPTAGSEHGGWTVTPRPLDRPTELKLLTGGLSPNYADVPSLLASQAVALTPRLLVILGGAPAAWLVVALVVSHRNRLRGDARYARRWRACARANRATREALRRQQPGEVLEGLERAFTTYVADRLDLPAAAPTSAEVREALAQMGIDKSMVHEVCEFLEMCDAFRFAPGGVREIDPRQAARRVESWIRELERRTR